MSTTTETILLQVDIQANNARLVELQKQLNETKAANAALNQSFKEGRITGDELAAGQVRLAQSSKDTRQEIGVLTKANAQQDTANKAATGSTEQLRAQYNLAAVALSKLSNEERENSVAGQKLQAQTAALNAEILRQESAYGKLGRNVGNYNAGVKDVNVVNGQLTGGLQTAVEKGLSPFKNELERGSGLLGKFKSGTDLVKQGLGLLKGAGEAGSLGFKAIAGGIALTGIGLFVIAISAVVAYFTQTAEGGRQLAAVLGGLGGVLQVATDLATSFGKAVYMALTNPLEAAKKLGLALLDALEHPIDTANALANGVKKVGEQIKVAYDASKEFAARQRDLTIAKRELDKEDAKNESRVNVLIRLTKDRSKSSQEQVAALKEAGQIEAKITQDNIALKQKELALINDRIKSAGAGKTAELKADKAAKELEIIQASAAQDEVNAKIKARESVFLEKLRADAAAAALLGRQDAVKNKQTEAEQLLLTVAKGSAAELALLRRKIDLVAAMELTDLKKTAAARKLVLSTAEVEKQKLQEEFNQRAIEAAKKHDAATVAEAEREYKEAQQNLENYLNDQRAAIGRDQAAGIVGENEAQRRLNALEKAGLRAQMVLNDDYRKDNAKANKQAADLEIKENNRVKAEKKKIKETEQQIYQAALAAGVTTSDAVISALGAESEAGRAALVVKKTLALAEIAINVEKELRLNAETGKKISESAAPYTIPLGVAYVVTTDALTIASGAASAAKILGFNTGGVVPGSGDPRRDSVPAMLAPGEVVMNPARPETLPPLLAHLSQASGIRIAYYNTGGVAGQPASRSYDGGLAARAAGNTLPALDYPTLIKAIADFGQFDVGVTTLRKAEARYDRGRNLSTLG